MQIAKNERIVELYETKMYINLDKGLPIIYTSFVNIVTEKTCRYFLKIDHI
jgi:hypothetical protein